MAGEDMDMIENKFPAATYIVSAGNIVRSSQKELFRERSETCKIKSYRYLENGVGVGRIYGVGLIVG